MRRYSLRPTPTLLHPDCEAGSVTLKTPRHQEAFTIYRSNFGNIGVETKPLLKERAIHPDINPESEIIAPFYSREREQAFYVLNTLRLLVLYIFGRDSSLASPEVREEKLRHTGSGSGEAVVRSLDRPKKLYYRVVISCQWRMWKVQRGRFRSGWRSGWECMRSMRGCWMRGGGRCW